MFPFTPHTTLRPAIKRAVSFFIVIEGVSGPQRVGSNPLTRYVPFFFLNGISSQSRQLKQQTRFARENYYILFRLSPYLRFFKMSYDLGDYNKIL